MYIYNYNGEEVSSCIAGEFNPLYGGGDFCSLLTAPNSHKLVRNYSRKDILIACLVGVGVGSVLYLICAITNQYEAEQKRKNRKVVSYTASTTHNESSVKLKDNQNVSHFRLDEE